MKTFLTLALAVMLTGGLAMTNAHPARADQAAVTRNTILGAAALVAGIAVESNVAHKRQVANTVEGYLPDGSTVYGDGRVVSPNGQTYYPGNYGQRVACNAGSCYLTGQPNNGYGYNYPGYNSPAYNNQGYNYGTAPSDNDGDENNQNGYYQNANYNPNYNQNGYSTVSYQNAVRTYRLRHHRTNH